MKIFNNYLMAIVLLFMMSACYEQPVAPIDDLIGENLGSIPAIPEFTWKSDNPKSGGEVGFTINFWSDTDIEAINIYSSIDNGITQFLEQTNAYSEAGFSDHYRLDTIAYTFTIPVTDSTEIQYMGEVVNSNSNTATLITKFKSIE